MFKVGDRVKFNKLGNDEFTGRGIWYALAEYKIISIGKYKDITVVSTHGGIHNGHAEAPVTWYGLAQQYFDLVRSPKKRNLPAWF